MEKFRNKLLTLCFLVFSIFGVTPLTLGKELRQKWVFLNPEGTVKIEPIKMNLHPLTLEGKTVMLRWNGKHN